MLDNSLKLDHLNLSVHNVEESIDWYGRVFGFTLVEKGISHGQPWAIIRQADALICMYQRPDREFLDGDALAARKLHGFNHFGLRITDGSAWERTIIQEKVEVTMEYKYPHSYAWYVNDPTGYEIEVALWDGNIITFSETSAAVCQHH